LSPAPGKSQFGFGVIKSFPFFNEYSKTHLSQLHKQREFQSRNSIAETIAEITCHWIAGAVF
jgi:hypothetical protein